MRLIHPKKYWRFAKGQWSHVVDQWRLWCFKREAQRCGVQLVLGEGVRVEDCHIWTEGSTLNRKLSIGDKCNLLGAKFAFHGSNSTIRLWGGVKINATFGHITAFHVSEKRSIEIGECCLFANSIWVSTSDWHKVYNRNERINVDKSIKIGKHVWIGERAYITKGVSIADGSIVGACSVVTKSLEQKNVMIAGNPAIIKKENISWEE